MIALRYIIYYLTTNFANGITFLIAPSLDTITMCKLQRVDERIIEVMN